MKEQTESEKKGGNNSYVTKGVQKSLQIAHWGSTVLLNWEDINFNLKYRGLTETPFKFVTTSELF